MFERLQRLFRRKPALGRGTGSSRPRTYSADSGYVYEYSFAGFRSDGGEYEYVFLVGTGRSGGKRVRLLLPAAEVQEWAGRGRELTASERYGVAKVCLKFAMDRWPDPNSVEAEIRPDQAEVAAVADMLDL